MLRRGSLGLVFVLIVAGADWRQFRGTDSTGVSTDPVPRPVDPARNQAWKVELPGRGLSSPIVVGDRIFLTASGGPRQDRLWVLAFDAGSGKRLWERGLWATGPAQSHPKSCMAVPTPVSDGRRVVALFATDDLACFDLDGNLLWVRSLYEENPGATDGRGLASSPVIAGGVVVIHLENQNVSFATGIDLESGASRWRVDRPREVCWSSPLILPGKTPADELVLLQGSTRLSACDPATGKEVWGFDRASDPIASSTRAGNILYVPGEKGMAAYELGPDRQAPRLLWEKQKIAATTASPVVAGGRLFTVRGPILITADARSGEIVGQLRLKGPISASPVAGGGRIVCVHEEGLIQVVEPDAKDGKVVETSSLGETILATPALSGGAMYIRSDKHLWRIGRPPTVS